MALTTFLDIFVEQCQSIDWFSNADRGYEYVCRVLNPSAQTIRQSSKSICLSTRTHIPRTIAWRWRSVVRRYNRRNSTYFDEWFFYGKESIPRLIEEHMEHNKLQGKHFVAKGLKLTGGRWNEVQFFQSNLTYIEMKRAIRSKCSHHAFLPCKRTSALYTVPYVPRPTIRPLLSKSSGRISHSLTYFYNGSPSHVHRWTVEALIWLHVEASYYLRWHQSSVWLNLVEDFLDSPMSNHWDLMNRERPRSMMGPTSRSRVSRKPKE